MKIDFMKIFSFNISPHKETKKFVSYKQIVVGIDKTETRFLYQFNSDKSQKEIVKMIKIHDELTRELNGLLFVLSVVQITELFETVSVIGDEIKIVTK